VTFSGSTKCKQVETKFRSGKLDGRVAFCYAVWITERFTTHSTYWANSSRDFHLRQHSQQHFGADCSSWSTKW